MLQRRVYLLSISPTIFELICCRKLIFCCFPSKINILSVKGSHEINILTYIDLKSPFLSLHAAEIYTLLVSK